jgi:hypothetical protein
MSDPKTLGKAAEQGRKVTVRCDGCQHTADVDPAPLAKRFGDMVRINGPWKAALKCNHCGSRQVSACIATVVTPDAKPKAKPAPRLKFNPATANVVLWPSSNRVGTIDRAAQACFRSTVGIDGYVANKVREVELQRQRLGLPADMRRADVEAFEAALRRRIDAYRATTGADSDEYVLDGEDTSGDRR